MNTPRFQRRIELKDGKPPSGEILYGKMECRAKAGDDTLVELCFSSFKRDDHGTRFDPAGCDLSQYRENPFVSFSHARDGGIFRLPVGKGLPDTLRSDADGKLFMQVRFTPEDVFEFGYQICKLVKNGFLSGVSIGADPDVDAAEMVREANGETTIVFHKWRLFDISIVGLPSNDDALVAERCKEFKVRRSSFKAIERMMNTEEVSDEEVAEVAEEIAGAPVLTDKATVADPPAASATKADEERAKDVLRQASDHMPKCTDCMESVMRCMNGAQREKETKEQIKHREYFEENREVMKLYRNMLERMFRVIREKPTGDEVADIGRLVGFISSTTKVPVVRSAPVETRQANEAVIGVIVAKLAPVIAQQFRERIAGGYPIRKKDELIRELVSGINLPISSPK